MKRRRCCLVSHSSGWWITGDTSGALSSRFRTNISPSELGDDSDVTIGVTYSAVNYKDALALTGSPGVARTSPLIPGIDGVGEVEESPDGRFSRGDRVVITGWGYGESRHGGLATTMKANPDHLVRIPEGMTDQQAATFGTAGITAALAVRALENAGVHPSRSSLPVAVTGAAGAVGSFALFFLARHGYQVTAITGRTDEADYLRSLGASDVMSRQEVLAWPERPLDKERFSAVIDQAGGPLLATLLASLESGGVAASCGLAGSSDLHTTVLPFILRGVSLLGVNSVYQPQDVRQQLWDECQSYTSDIPWGDLTQAIGLEQAGEIAQHILAGVTRGRVVVKVA
jgi:acrylyl-CoA reductase (NADPH)